VFYDDDGKRKRYGFSLFVVVVVVVVSSSLPHRSALSIFSGAIS
jgi:hypothetical protein